MPLDITIVKKLDMTKLSPATLAAIGNAQYLFSIYENDIQFNSLKGTMVVEGTNKLVQSILKILLTDIGSHFEDSQYGAGIVERIGNKLTDTEFAFIRDSVYNALGHYNDIAAPGNPNGDEVIFTVDEVRVMRDDVDPRIIYIYIAVTTQLGTSVRIAAMRAI